MKTKLLFTLLMISLITNAFADCQSAYRKAGKSRDRRNYILVAGGVVATGGGAVILSSGAAATLLVLGYQVVLTGVWPSTLFSENNFEEIASAFHAAKRNEENKDLSRLIRKGLEKAGLEDSPEERARAIDLLIDGFNDETFCPVVRVKRNGKEKRAVFNQGALIKYISENI